MDGHKPADEEAEEHPGSRSVSQASGTEPEIVFSKSMSMPISEDTELGERAQTDSSIEYLMTAQEIQELDKRLADVIDNLQKQRDDYETWENSLNKRRLEAYGRLKALGKFHRQRMEVYDTVKEYIQTMNNPSNGR